MHWNIQGIINKIESVQLYAGKHDIAVVGICEHWCSRAELDLLRLPGFKVASAYCRTGKGRGGSAIYLREGLEFEELGYLVDNSISSVCEVAAVFVNSFNIICLEVYRVPDNNNFEIFIECMYNVLSIMYTRNKSDVSVVLCGDFNVDFLVDSYYRSVMYNLLLCYNLKCTVMEVTRPSSVRCTGTCIDNIATSVHPERIVSAFVEPTVVSDHYTVIVNMVLQTKNCKKPMPNGLGIVVRPINDLNSMYFNTLIRKVNWQNLYVLSTVEDKFEYFLNVLLRIVDIALPVKVIVSRECRIKKPKWYNDRLSVLKQQCLDTYSMFQVLGDNYYRDAYKALKSNYRNEIVKAKKIYFGNRVMKANNKPKAVWSIVRDNLNINDKSCREANKHNLSSEEFNNFFIDNIKSIVSNIPKSVHNVSYYLNKFKNDRLGKDDCNFSIDHFRVEEVYNAIFSLSSSSCLDVYFLNSDILKMAAPFIDEVLTSLFNQCIDDSVFPKCLKLTKVIPVHKKGVKSDYANYRPVSIIPVISKVLERLLNNRIVSYLEKCNLLSCNQYGFRAKRSTVDAITKFMKKCVNGLDDKNKVLGCFYDMSKAFDTISHNVLLDKLLFYGFDIMSVNLIRSYLENRLQAVFYDHCISSYLLVETGVPQGSILGPTLFILCVNDMPSSITSNVIDSFMYADDLAVQIICPYSNFNNHLYTDANSTILDWTAANSLSLNVNKTQIIEFRLNSLDNDNVKFLGLNLQSNVKWNNHINTICAKVAKGIFILRKLRSFVTADVLKTVYYAHIQSHLRYAILVWGSSSSTRKLLILQKKALRVMFNVNARSHCKPLFRKNNILTVYAIYIIECILYVKCNLRDFQCNNTVHNHFTRQSNLLRTRRCNFSATSNSFCEIGRKMYNMLPENIKLLNVNSFKRKITSILCDLSVYNVQEFMDYLSCRQ